MPAGGASLATAPDIPWAQPAEIAINNTGPVATTDTARMYDCSWLTYRIIDDYSKTMHDGCFMATAFGLFDPDANMLIYNGTDEAIPVIGTGAFSVLPNSVSVANFGNYSGIGNLMYLYTNFPSALTKQGTPRYGRTMYVSGQPNYLVKNDKGQPMPVNPMAMGYAARSQWMVTEYPVHALVRVNLADFSILPFGKSFFIPGMPYANHTAHMAITEDGRYAAVVSNELSSFEVYDLKSCKPPVTIDTTNDLQPYDCQHHDYWAYIKSQVTGDIRRISQVKFVQDGLLSFTVTYTDQSSESYLLAPDGPITSLIPYLGLGDSFTSGEGAWNYRRGTDTSVNHCHLSVHSYPLRLNGDLFSNGGHSVACSGAHITDIINQSPDYAGQVGDHRSAADREADGSEVSILHDFSPGYLAQHNFVTAYQPGIVTVQIGGNDIGFKDILLNCLKPGNCYQNYEDRLEVEQTISRNYGKWVSLYKRLQQESPASRVYAIGYPQITSMTGECSLNTPLSQEDIGFARDVTVYLNGVIQKAAKAAGVQFVDITDALAGYELCSGQTAQPGVNGITAGGDTLGIIGRESFHPTALGQDLIAQAIRHATHNFAHQPKLMPDRTQTTPAPSDNDALLQAPKSGRATSAVTPASGIAGPAVAGSTMTVDIDGLAYGLSPLTSYTISIGGTMITTVRSDSQGNIHTSFTLPTSIATGPISLSVSGAGQTGSPITVSEVIYAQHSVGDYDGDGILNEQDSCPAVINQGVDVDRDGVDDVCDSFVGPPIFVNFSFAHLSTHIKWR